MRADRPQRAFEFLVVGGNPGAAYLLELSHDCRPAVTVARHMAEFPLVAEAL
jgi:hypothetical protein